MGKTGREIHAEADHAREDGHFLKALQLIEETCLMYSEENDSVGFSELQGSRFLTLRHLYEKTQDQNFLILAKHAAMSAVELAEKSNDPTALAMPLFNLAKSQETLGELPNAVLSYRSAIQAQENTPLSYHNRRAVLNDMKIHLAACEYKNGHREALPEGEEALHDLENDSLEGAYTKDVWTSGGYMKFAEVLKTDNPQKAKEYLQKAKEIIDGNPDLTLRKAQWQKLATSFN
jgi:hypothetical protein